MSDDTFSAYKYTCTCSRYMKSTDNAGNNLQLFMPLLSYNGTKFKSHCKSLAL